MSHLDIKFQILNHGEEVICPLFFAMQVTLRFPHPNFRHGVVQIPDNSFVTVYTTLHHIVSDPAAEYIPASRIAFICVSRFVKAMSLEPVSVGTRKS